ncbi:tigger transposable element-derived protein 7-like [Palaemon carinicauda]|uniref:tigger transposable element-derived protein 7-like n=1 Tax=Palaemon carinicauda TaxID=392227 RepID=UPI0035B57646
MERLLLIWIKEKHLAGDSATETIICENASRIYDDLKRKTAAEKEETSTTTETFKASRGWLDNFKKRTAIHSAVRHREAASSNAKASVDFVTTFALVIAQHGFITQQVFNCDETGLFWQKMLRRTFITAEKRLPGHNPMKDQLTLALCAKASGDYPGFTEREELSLMPKGLKLMVVAVNIILKTDGSLHPCRDYRKEHIRHQRIFLDHLRQNGLIVLYDKCTFNANEVLFLRQHIIPEARGSSPIPISSPRTRVEKRRIMKPRCLTLRSHRKKNTTSATQPEMEPVLKPQRTIKKRLSSTLTKQNQQQQQQKKKKKKKRKKKKKKTTRIPTIILPSSYLYSRSPTARPIQPDSGLLLAPTPPCIPP